MRRDRQHEKDAGLCVIGWVRPPVSAPARSHSGTEEQVHERPVGPTVAPSSARMFGSGN